MKIVYNDDPNNLTPHQSKLKWYIYMELDLEDGDDVAAVLESLLKDIKHCNPP